MICSYYDANTLEQAKQVDDKEINELLQEVRKIDDRYYLQERKYKEKLGWFRNPTEKAVYNLLYNLSGTDCQIINFAQDHDYSINNTVSKSYILTLFHGYINGYKRGINQPITKQ